jgi:anti-anti-sigma factor
MQNYKIEAVPGDGSCTLFLSGEFDLAAAPELREVGSISLSSPDVEILLVDLGGVTFMDSTAIGALVGLRNTATVAGKHVTLTHIPDRVQRIMDITGLNEVFEVEE